MSLHLTSYLIIVAILWGMAALLYVQEWQWSLAVKQGLKGVLYANSDSWSMTKFKRIERLSWCLSVTEAQTFVYQYSRGV